METIKKQAVNSDAFDAYKLESKNSARKLAIQVAKELNPSERAYNAQLNSGNITKPTVSQVLIDAENIYQWLIKDL